MFAPLINGIRHSWSDIRINFLGRTVTGVTAISYDDTVNHANHYGAGNMPVDRGSGNYEAKATISLKQYEVSAIEQLSPTGRIQDIKPFDIVVAYVNPEDVLVTHVIRNCQFKTNNRMPKQNDTTIDIELELIVSHIDWK